MVQLATGNGPPANVEPLDLWMQITALPRPSRPVDFPRKSADRKPIGQIAMVPLTQEESYAATTETERFVRKMLKQDGLGIPGSNERSEGYSTLYENRAACEVLFRACKRVDDVTRPFFPSVDEVARKLTVDEIGVLMRMYALVCSEVGPNVSRMSQEEYDAWIEKLATGGASDPLGFLTLAARSDFLMYMAAQLWRLRTAKASPGELLEEST